MSSFYLTTCTSARFNIEDKLTKTFVWWNILGANIMKFPHLLKQNPFRLIFFLSWHDNFQLPNHKINFVNMSMMRQHSMYHVINMCGNANKNLSANPSSNLSTCICWWKSKVNKKVLFHLCECGCIFRLKFTGIYVYFRCFWEHKANFYKKQFPNESKILRYIGMLPTKNKFARRSLAKHPKI